MKTALYALVVLLALLLVSVTAVVQPLACSTREGAEFVAHLYKRMAAASVRPTRIMFNVVERYYYAAWASAVLSNYLNRSSFRCWPTMRYGHDLLQHEMTSFTWVEGRDLKIEVYRASKLDSGEHVWLVMVEVWHAA